MVWINEICTLHPQCPWGGIKHSGMGKDLSRYGIREFVNIKHVNINLGSDKTRSWWFPYGEDKQVREAHITNIFLNNEYKRWS